MQILEFNRILIYKCYVLPRYSKSTCIQKGGSIENGQSAAASRGAITKSESVQVAPASGRNEFRPYISPTANRVDAAIRCATALLPAVSSFQGGGKPRLYPA